MASDCAESGVRARREADSGARSGAWHARRCPGWKSRPQELAGAGQKRLEERQQLADVPPHHQRDGDHRRYQQLGRDEHG